MPEPTETSPARRESIEARLDRLEAENRQLRADLEARSPAAVGLTRLSKGPGASGEAGTSRAGEPVDRREMLRKGIIAAGLATTGAVLLDGDPAAAQAFTEAVTVTSTQDGSHALYVQNPGSGSQTSAIYGLCGTGTGGVFQGKSGVKATAFSGGGAGIAGSAPDGPGTTGTSTSGYGVYGLSNTSYGTAGRSTSSYGVVGVSVNSDGVYGLSEAAGSNGVRGDTANGKGVYGKATGTGAGVQGEAVSGNALRGIATVGKGVLGSSNSGIGVHGISSSAAAVYGASITGVGVEGFSSTKVGIYGRSDADYGVYGVSTNTYGTAGRSTNSYGVVGVSQTNDGVYGTSELGNGNGVKGQTLNGSGVVGLATTGVGGLFTSNGAQLRLSLTGTRQAPILDATPHVAGDVVRDGAGDFWACVATGTPGTWRKLAGNGTAGSFHVLPSPARVYDSRTGAPQGPKAALDANVARPLDLKVGSSGVPAGATAAMVTLLLVNCASGDGNFTIWANGAAKPTANNMVWGGTAKRYSSLSVTGLDTAARCQVLSSLKTDFVLDVIGYYR